MLPTSNNASVAVSPAQNVPKTYLPSLVRRSEQTTAALPAQNELPAIASSSTMVQLTTVSISLFNDLSWKSLLGIYVNK